MQFYFERTSEHFIAIKRGISIFRLKRRQGQKRSKGNFAIRLFTQPRPFRTWRTSKLATLSTAAFGSRSGRSREARLTGAVGQKPPYRWVQKTARKSLGQAGCGSPANFRECLLSGDEPPFLWGTSRPLCSVRFSASAFLIDCLGPVERLRVEARFGLAWIEMRVS